MEKGMARVSGHDMRVINKGVGKKLNVVLDHC